MKTHSSEIQSLRGKLGGIKSKGGGRKYNELSINNLKPWEKLNISRSTYYRRIKNER